MAVHPRIKKLAEEYCDNRTYPNEMLKVYDRSWLERAATGWYYGALEKISAEPDGQSSLADRLCAEIGFWRGVDQLHRARSNEPFKGAPYRPS